MTKHSHQYWNVMFCFWNLVTTAVVVCKLLKTVKKIRVAISSCKSQSESRAEYLYIGRAALNHMILLSLLYYLTLFFGFVFKLLKQLKQWIKNCFIKICRCPTLFMIILYRLTKVKYNLMCLEHQNYMFCLDCLSGVNIN